MGKKRHKPEEMITLLRTVEMETGKGGSRTKANSLQKADRSSRRTFSHTRMSEYIRSDNGPEFIAILLRA